MEKVRKNLIFNEINGIEDKISILNEECNKKISNLKEDVEFLKSIINDNTNNNNETIQAKTTNKIISNNILLTVPHFKCLDEENLEHYCDSISGESADLIKDDNNNFILIKGDVVRHTCDLNRIQCRYNTNFRKLIRNNLMKYNIKFVLDVHSFPNYSNPELEIYLLDDGDMDYCKDFYNYLKNKNIKCGLFKGINNDIMDETRELGFKSILIEFNESLNKERLKEICSIVSDYLKKIY